MVVASPVSLKLLPADGGAVYVSVFIDVYFLLSE